MLTNTIVVISQIKEVISSSVMVASEDELIPSPAVVILSSNSMMDRQALLFISIGLILQMDKTSNDTEKLSTTLHMSKSLSVPESKRTCS